MKLFKNFILIALCLSLLIAVLAACGDDDIPADTAGETGSVSSQGSEESTTEKSVYTGNPIEGGSQTTAPASGGETSGNSSESSETVNSGPVDEAESNGFTGDGMELPGVTP